MQSAERRRQIASLAAVRGRVTVIDLAQQFTVTAETIRRDLAILDAEGILCRVHGGAVPVRNYRTDLTSYEARAKASLAAKKAIARRAVQLLPVPGSTIFLDGGTTTALMATLMADIPHLQDNAPPYSVITNSLPVALSLADSTLFDIKLLGGKVRPQSRAVVGDTATRGIAVLRADVAFVGTSALTLNHGLSTPDEQEGAVKRAMVTNARQTIALCDSTKFGLDYLVSFASIEDLSMVITDDMASNDYVSALNEAGIHVEFAASPSDSTT
ncbi:DeoR/GlpR family DNA-binding transcription regulator [Corynebacterium anserum]|uniref:Lactose phosphotransferase system repressor n=1 Tax=Corynebacterium anserum TaxID=2684406 RepID=A0A7G7YR37_9CORY|nr:DeoR/GlpR family DNA-binding transcription regulator [Corynebacterium anserum]MBC2681704.1 DeoR family transcriptional regulator [Corynebacterium anserum]QNH96957.1 DeoR family transcriptional regulator [Corynebacterium anserum]